MLKYSEIYCSNLSLAPQMHQFSLCEISLIDFFVCQTQFMHPKIYTVCKTEFYNFQIKFEANNYL